MSVTTCRLRRVRLWTLPVRGLADAAYQFAGEARDARRYPLPGEYVNLAGRHLRHQAYHDIDRR